jgi:hypothetical protein
LAATVFSCATSERTSGFTDTPDAGPPNADAEVFGSSPDAGPKSLDRDPVSCAEAATYKTYVGCDYWPTATANAVQNVFDFAIVIANVGKETANVTVKGPSSTNQTLTVKAGQLEKVYLPWVNALKGGASSGVVKGGAFHVVSDKPVVVYQFSPLEFQAQGGPPTKDWSKCTDPATGLPASPCYSYSNDASLLLPSPAMTGTYRIMGSTGWSRHPVNPLTGKVDTTKPVNHNASSFFAVTATEDNTKVTVKLSQKGKVVSGIGVAATPGGGTLVMTLNAGDVAQVVGDPGNATDFSGSLLTADRPVQVITGVPCMDFPFDVQACDHIEETVFPAETLGKHYVVTRPTGPRSNLVGHVVRVFGNQDTTTLTYKPSRPAGCPAKIDAGVVVDCGEVNIDFEVTGDKEFGVAMFQLGGEKADPEFIPGLNQPQGDPSQSFAITVEQYRKHYVFLAPTDYKTSFVDIVAPADGKFTIDGVDTTSSAKPIAGTSWLLARIKLGAGQAGAHVIDASQPIGIQVVGYGENTSYQYPGGLNLESISQPPVK